MFSVLLATVRYTMAHGNIGVIHPYMFEPETDSEEERTVQGCLQVSVSEW